MNKKVSGIACALVLVATIAYSKGKGAHEFDKGECALCHSEGSSAMTAEAYASLTAKCMTCHTTIYETGYMHPVDISPKKVKVPLDFPLSPSGTLTCATCHDIHTDQVTPYGQKSSFLRRYEKGKRFCDICHGNADAFAAGHDAVFKEAHFDSKYFTGDDQEQDIDRMSRNCLSCHDGSLASSVRVSAGKWRHSDNFMEHDNGGMHSIGMKYRDIVGRNKKASLRPLESVDKRIRFFDDGKVGCGSCHDPYSSLRKKLVIEDTESKLCFACHQMDGRKKNP